MNRDEIVTAICPKCGLIYMYRPATEFMDMCLSCSEEAKHTKPLKGQTYVIQNAKRAKTKQITRKHTLSIVTI